MRKYPYFDCPLTDIPSEESLLAIIHDEQTMPHDERRSQFLCHLRLMCLNFLQKEISGTASNLLIIIENEANKYCTNEHSQVFSHLKLRLHQVECEINDLFDSPDVVNFLDSIYFDLKKLLEHIVSVKLTIKNETTGKNNTHIKSHTLCTSLDELENLSSLNTEFFFAALTSFLNRFIEQLSKEKYFINKTWTSRTEHLDEDSSTDRFVSYLSAHILSLIPNKIIKINTRRGCLDGICDILITAPSGELIPVEAKNSKHADVWTALECQLINNSPMKRTKKFK